MVLFEWMVVIILKWCQDLCILPLNWWMIFFCSEVSEDELCWYSVEKSSWAWNVGFDYRVRFFFSPGQRLSMCSGLLCHFFVFLEKAKCVDSFLGHWAKCLLPSGVKCACQWTSEDSKSFPRWTLRFWALSQIRDYVSLARSIHTSYTNRFSKWHVWNPIRP